MRALVVAPAHVHAQLLGRDVRGAWFIASMLQRARLAEGRRGRRRGTGCAGPSRGRGSRSAARSPPWRPPRTLPHRVRDGVEIGLLRWRSGRCGRTATITPGDAALMKPPDAFTPPSAALRLSTSVCGRLRVAHADRRVAGRRLAARAAGIAEHLLLQLREIREVLVDERVTGAAEAVEAVLHVGRIARLRHLAVVDDIDARLRLFLHDLRDRPAHAHPERLRVDRHAALLGVHHLDEVVGPRQAAGMGGEKTLRCCAAPCCVPA